MKGKFKSLGSLCCLLMSLFVVSCADGFDDNERFSGGVKNAQLESPKIDDGCFASLANSDGTESVKLSWPFVYGAGGYLLNVSIVDDPTNPQFLIKDSIVDGCSAIFKKLEDTKYEVSIKTLGNEKLNNKEAESPTLYAYTTLVHAIVVPEGQDIAEYIMANIEESDKELGFELQAGKTYTLNSIVDFGLNTVTFRGDKVNRPTVVVGANGGLMTQGGLKVKFINFDCSAMTQVGILSLSDNPSLTISTESLGYKADGANQDGFVVVEPIIVQDCNFKGMTNSFLYGSKKNWSLCDFRIVDCILQFSNSGSNSILNLYGASNGLIKDMTLKNSTFYNLADNGSGYFMRYSNSSNAQPKKIFGNGGNSSTFTITNCTFSKTMNNKDFANNLANTNTLVFNVNYNIFYDTYRLNKLLSSQGKIYTQGNTIIGIIRSIDGSDLTKKDVNGNFYAVEEDPKFVGPIDQAFDLNQAKGGVDFKPTAPIATQNKSGDPRWYE